MEKPDHDNVYDESNQTFTTHSAHSPTLHARLLKKAGHHFTSGKELHYTSLGHNPQFQLSITLTLPVPIAIGTGKEHYIPEPKS